MVKQFANGLIVSGGELTANSSNCMYAFYFSQDAFVKSFPDNHSQSWVPTGLLSATFLVGLVTVVSVLKS